jgi:RNA polymerase sigma factor (sigma-70 family)
MTTREQERFLNLVEDHKKILYKVCHSYCRNPDDRDDLAQEIIVQLWRSFRAFDERARFSTWMYRIALNVAISFYRRESVRTRHVLPGSEHLLEAVDETGDRSEEVEMLYRWIEELDPLNKALVILYLDGNNYQEIADIMGISQTNVATKISRLKQAMREKQGASQHGTR